MGGGVSNRKFTVGVVGAAGFVGSALVRSLNRFGDIDVVEFVRPMFDLAVVDNWVLPSVVDCLVIASGSTQGSSEDLDLINATGPARLVEHLRDHGLQKVIYLSSGAVYGEVDALTHTQTTPSPNSPYGLSKLNGEQKVQQAAQGLRSSVLRLYFPYGSCQELPRLIPRIVNNIKSGQAIACRGDGGPFLSFTHIDDLVEILISDFIIGGFSGVFNIASDQIISIRQMAIAIANHLNVAVSFTHTSDAVDCVSQAYVNKTEWKHFNPGELF